MGRLDNTCKELHTALFPQKDRVRRSWMSVLHRTQDLLTISHGIFPELDRAGWKGQIQSCDLDEGVRTCINHIRENPNGPLGDYPDLNILPPGCGILSTTQSYCKEHGAKRLGAVDIDLTASIRGVWQVARPVVEVLQDYHYKGLILLTFRNGRADGFGQNALPKRMKFLRESLPKGVECVLHDTYQSTYIERNAKRHKGSPMCMATLRCN
jgi:hypothetical protein